MSAAAPNPLYVPASPKADARSGNLWMTADAIKAKAHVSSRTLQRYAEDRSAITRELPVRGRNGKPVREYLVQTLPMELRTKLEPPTQQRGMLLAAGSEKTGIGCLFPPATEVPSQRIALSAEALRLAEQRLAAIRPLLEYGEAAHRGKYSALQLRDGRAVRSADLLAEYIAETIEVDGAQVSRPTLWRWVKSYRAGGLSALARKPRVDKGKSHFFTRFPAAATLAAAEYHKPYATAQRAMDAIYRDRALLRIPDDELPDHTTVWRFLESLPKPMAILAREGQRRWNETCAPHLTRGYADVPAGAIYTADHMIHDVEVRNDCFASVATDAPMRLRFTCIMDLRSRKIVGFCWTAEGDSRSIATALRRAVSRFGVPQVFYCDNGQDFKKVAKGARRVSRDEIVTAGQWLEGLGALQMLGVELQLCLPYHPQSKNIERCFRTVHLGLDAIFHTYLTGNPQQRPDAAILAGEEHRKLAKRGRGSESSLMPASIFIRLAETWIEQDYNAQHRHSGNGMDGRTPDAVFDELCPPAKRRMADPQILASLLFERRKALVQRTAVTMNKRRYVPLPESPADYANLYELNGREVILTFDPNEPDFAVAYDANGVRVAELQAERLSAHPLTPNAETGAQIAAMSQVRGRLLKSTAITVQTMHQAVALAGHRSALEHLADRALVSLPVDDLVSQKVPKKPAIEPVSTQQMHAEDLGNLLVDRLRRKQHETQQSA